MIWLSFVLAVLLTAAGGFYAWDYSNKMKLANPNDEFAEYVLYAAYTAWGLTGVVLINFCCCF